MSERRTLEPWRLSYDRWDADEEPLREALTTLGNGVFATRGAAEEAVAGGAHYPGTYLAGGYNRLTSEVAGREVDNEDLVNWPNWLPLTFRVRGGAWLDLAAVEILAYRQVLDLQRATLRRDVRFRDGGGRSWRLASERFVSLADPHVAAIRWELTSLDWSGEIEIRAALDGRVANAGVARYRALAGQHFDVLAAERGPDDTLELLARTTQSRIVMAQAAATDVQVGGVPGAPGVVARRVAADPGVVAHHLVLRCAPHETVRVDKRVAIFTSRDAAISEPRAAARETLAWLPDYASLRADHELAWRHLWARADLQLAAAGDDVYPQLVLRLHLFHLLSVASPHVMDRDCGIPARGLHGEAYRGHIFWDELFVFPLLNLQLPEAARALILYRWRRLDAARRAARAAGFRGAMFPWQSGSDGREETQVMHLNPASGRWHEDESHLQRHVGVAVAWNVWQHYQVTGDVAFLARYGAEMLVEIARFWSSIATPTADGERFEIRGVVGPDEFHTRYPGASRPGLDNNAYTNVMAAWVLQTAAEALQLLTDGQRRELLERLGISHAERARWELVGRRLLVPFHGDGVISQFEGWDRLAPLDWDGLRERHTDIRRLDRVLRAEGDDPNRYQASKQADVLMLLYLLPGDALAALFGRLGYALPPEAVQRTVDHYLERTSHGSTLSSVVHSWVLARSRRRASWQLFRDALASDIEDIQGGTTSEGIHLGAMAGTVDLVVRCYAGITLRDDTLWIAPQLPAELERLRVRLLYRGQWVVVAIDQREVTVTAEEGPSGPVNVGFDGTRCRLQQGQRRTFRLPDRAGEQADG